MNWSGYLVKKAVELLKEIEDYKQIVERADVLAVILHGSFQQNPKKEHMTNDIDLLIVTENLTFSTWITKTLLGFEHIRHTKHGLDLYLTDREHYKLAMEVLRTSKEFTLFKREELPENKKALLESKEIAKNIPKNFDPWYKEGLDPEAYAEIKRRWETEAISWKDYPRVLRFWLDWAKHSWKNTFGKKG